MPEDDAVKPTQSAVFGFILGSYRSSTYRYQK